MEKTLEKRKTKSYEIFNQIAGTYDLLNRLLSFGIDKSWRTKLLKSIPADPKGANLLDLATGTGDLCFELAKHPSISHIQATDLSTGMLEFAAKKAPKMDPKKKISFSTEDGCNLSFEDASFNYTTVSFGIRNFPSTLEGLKQMHRVLKPGGRSYILEFSLPKNPIVKFIYLTYFRYILPFIGNIISGHKDAYSYLNQTVETYPYGDEFKNLMLEAGFETVDYSVLTFGICTLYVGEKA